MIDSDKILNLQAAINGLWSALPTLIGEDWPSFARELQSLFEQLANTSDPAQSKRIYDAIRLLFFDYEQANAQLVELLQQEQTLESLSTRGGIQPSSTVQESAASTVDTNGGSFVAGDVNTNGGNYVGRDQHNHYYSTTNPTVTRYSDILAPSRVPVEERFPLIVGLTCQPNPDSSEAIAMQLKSGQVVQVMLTPLHHLEVLGARMKPITVLAEQDSEPAVFYLRAQQAGDHHLRIDFWSDGQPVASSDLAIRAGTKSELVTLSQVTAQPVSLAECRVPYPDLVMRISTLDQQLHFDLHYGDMQFKHFAGERLRSDPEQFRHQLLQEIEGLLAAADNSEVDVNEELDKIGQRLYRELWPLELRREYRRFRQQVRTFVIFSDEPWIPWELIKPYDDEDLANVVDDDFLCLHFDFARWVTPAAQPAQLFPIQSLAVVSPCGTNLTASSDEVELLRTWAKAKAWQDCTPAPATKKNVEKLLRGDQAVNLWHFACHGTFDAGSPGRSLLYLEEESQLSPDDLVGKAATRLRKDRPFVFLNACEVGSSGLSLTGLAGWAKTLVQDCGVGAFLAPMWMVEDEYAQQFAQHFYQAMQMPQTTLAQAVRHARRTLRQQAERSPIWLAYTLYGHPNALLGLEQETK
ncbi:MAG: CHAT domain-containing protein [Caldilineaceae bacterium]